MHDLDIVLKPLSRPELGDIRIGGREFAVGRDEQPFASFEHDIIVMLSRRHARIFSEGGVAFLADQGSTNGTTLNRARIDGAPCRLRDGDEICFGGVLTYRVEIAPRGIKPQPRSALTLTLSPEPADSGLAPIVVTRFPFLISKADPAFSRYRADHARHLSYISRRQAHIFLKGASVCVEDLGSTNGTFVDGQRLQEAAVPLQEGMLVAFGGEHFTYRVNIQRAADAPAPALAGVHAEAKARADAPVVADAGSPREREHTGDAQLVEINPAAAGKTTFVVAPDSFLDIFCVATTPAPNIDPNSAQAPADSPQPARRPSRWRTPALLSELASLLSGTDPQRTRRGLLRGAAVAAMLAAAAVAISLWLGSERELKDLMAGGEYAQAAVLAQRSLARHPDDAELKALATEAALKDRLPGWLAKLAARDFDGARAVLASLSQLGKGNPDLLQLTGELEWLGKLEQLVSSRGGPEAPIRIYADEDSIAALIDRWNEGTREHQRALARIASYVPQFSDPYAEALTHLRRLQSDATVYIAAIDRLKASISAELNRDRPEELDAVLKDHAQRYPGLGGLDEVRKDLARYVEIKDRARERSSGRLFALLRDARFVTPPFRQAYDALGSGGQLPPAALLQQYEAATQAWKEGKVAEAQASLQKMATGTWAAAVSKELERRQAVVARFETLQRSRGANGYAEQLLAFRGSLDPDEDIHFARATAADLDTQKDKMLAQAQDAMNRAQTLWQQYRSSGAIEAAQRIETTISSRFRNQARLLAEASRQAQQGMQTYAQVDAARPGQWAAIDDEIKAEVQQQRNALLELRNVLDPGLLKAKLALLGEQ